jgi:SAM-dependent methyltransferase
MIARGLAVLREHIPAEQRLRMRRHLLRLRRPRPTWLRLLRRTTPLSTYWGFDRGTPVDRYYIEQFVHAQRQDIRGRVLEIKDSGYTDRYGSGVRQRDVLDVDAANPSATLVADLAAADAIPADQFDCFILTQTLQLIYDTRAAIQHAHRILAPGGVLLVTVPCVSRIVPTGGLEGDYWRFTPASCARLFGDVFGAGQVTVRPYGNVLTAMAFLNGMAYQELARRELETHDPYFPVVIAVRAVKHAGS